MSSPVYYPESNDNLSSSRSQSQNLGIFSSSSQQHQSNTVPSQSNNSQNSQINKNESSDSLQASFRGAQIWGTDISVSNCMSEFEKFIKEFKLKNNELKYKKMLYDIEESQEYKYPLDCADLKSFNKNLYRQIVHYPQEIIPLFDAVVDREYNRMFTNDSSAQQIQIYPFNLDETKKMRDIDPENIDSLIQFEALVTRTSTVIPDLKMAFLKCSICKHDLEVDIDRGRISQPKYCGNQSCKAQNSYEIIHNRGGFTDKQLMRVQETPESIPAGETPQTVNVFLHGELIDSARPGDRLRITGIYRAVPVRTSKLRRNLKSIYRSYVDAVDIRKALRNKNETNNDEGTQLEGDLRQSQKEEKLRELSKDPQIYQKLVNSLAPSIWELEDVKKGLLCQLFGGTAKSRKNDSKFRSEINILLCGDPGTSKSQLLRHVHQISERGVYTSGKGSSAVGLTASISRDPETRETMLESGALVLSDKGICCIDEFDKLADSTRSILHEVMEQQTISIAKAGIICSLSARTSILAAANPRESRYDSKLSVVDNIKLPPTLLSRFDLIYIVLDKPNEKLDRKLAHHLVSLYCLEKDSKTTDFFDSKTLSEYINLARREIHPQITDDAATALVKSYLELRRAGRYRNKKVIAATPRQLESLIRISEALARMRFSELVLESDVKEATRLVKVATQSAATDPKTGIINMDLISVGPDILERKETQKNIDLLVELIDEYEKEQPMALLLSLFNSKSSQKLSHSQFRELLLNAEKRNLINCKGFDGKNPVVQRCDQ